MVARMLDQHRDGSGNFTRELRALAALALWHPLKILLLICVKGYLRGRMDELFHDPYRQVCRSA